MSAPVTLFDLQKMQRMAAALVVTDPIYLPVFERIEYELAAFEADENAISRARAIAACHRATAA